MPEPPARPARRRRRPDIAAAILLAVGLLLTVPPWHHSGPLTEVLSAWRPGPQPWPLTASIAAVVGLAVALAPVALRTPSSRALTWSSALAATVAAAAAALALAASPDYTSPTPAPFAMSVLMASGAVLGVARRPRP